MPRTAFSSACGIPALDLIRGVRIACSTPFIRPRPREWAWASPSAARSSRRTADGCGPAPMNRAALPLSSRCRSWRPLRPCRPARCPWYDASGRRPAFRRRHTEAVGMRLRCGRRGIVGAVLAWATLLSVIGVSFRPAIPVIWGDTPPFVESAFRTLEAGWPTVVGGRDPGYPAVLAVTFASGGDLATVVRLQQAAWAVLMLALAATAHGVTRNAVALVPIILVAAYPRSEE